MAPADEHVTLLNGNLATRTDSAAALADIAKMEARVEAGMSDFLKWAIGALVAPGRLIGALVTLH